MMTKLGVAVLWLGAVVSALAVVFVTHQSRVAIDQLETLRHEAADLHVASGQFLLERSTLAAYSRIETIALNELGMTVPTIEQVITLKP